MNKMRKKGKKDTEEEKAEENGIAIRETECEKIRKGKIATKEQG